MEGNQGRGSRRGLVFSLVRAGSLPKLEMWKKRAAPLRVPEQVAPETSTSKSVDIRESYGREVEKQNRTRREEDTEGILGPRHLKRSTYIHFFSDRGFGVAMIPQHYVLLPLLDL